MSAASLLRVEDILSDLTTLSGTTVDAGPLPSSQPSSTGVPAHALLRLGRSLLPADLQTDRRPGEGVKDSTVHQGSETSMEELATLLDKVSEQGGEADQERNREAALRLSHAYLALAQRTVAMNGSSSPSSTEGQAQLDPTFAVQFERLHRRVARLQAKNESELKWLREISTLLEGQAEEAQDVCTEV